MSSDRTEFTKENLDSYLKAVAKEYRRQIGKKMPAEILLIGGAAVLANYGFRDMTTDIDAVIQAASAMKDAINIVGDMNGLPKGWLNDDFTHTASYSPLLVQYSEYYRQFSNILTVRTVSAEYLIAMKLRSGRQYKSDFSDILGILSEHEKMGKPITMEKIETAVSNLYGHWDSLPVVSQQFIAAVMNDGRFEALYNEIKKTEKSTKTLLIRFEQKYPGVTKEKNVDSIIHELQQKESQKSIIERLRERKAQADQTRANAQYKEKDNLER